MNASDLAEFTPHPAVKSFPGVFSLLGEGLNSQTATPTIYVTYVP